MVDTPSQMVEVTALKWWTPPLNWCTPLSNGGGSGALRHHVICQPLSQEVEVLVPARARVLPGSVHSKVCAAVFAQDEGANGAASGFAGGAGSVTFGIGWIAACSLGRDASMAAVIEGRSRVAHRSILSCYTMHVKPIGNMVQAARTDQSPEQFCFVVAAPCL